MITHKYLLRRLLGVILIGMGVVLAAGGICLATLGGSFYYICIEASLVAAGLLVFPRASAGAVPLRERGDHESGLALWEVGFDWWQLVPRGVVIVVLGTALALPPIVRSLKRGSRSTLGSGGWVALYVSLVAYLGTVGLAASVASHDIRAKPPGPQIGAGTIASAGVPAGERHAYQRTPHGRRHSRLDQITPGNVANLKALWTYHTVDVRSEGDPGETTYEVTPPKVGDKLYLCTP